MKYRNPNSPFPPNRAARPQPDRRKPQKKPARPNTSSPVQKPPVPLPTGPVKILKRGEELPKPVELPNPSKENRSPPKQKVPDLGSAVRSGPKPSPKKAPKQTRVANPVNPVLGFYAGSTFCAPSPPPSSLPLPSFFPKKTAVVFTTNEAGSEILKLLGLNLP